MSQQGEKYRNPSKPSVAQDARPGDVEKTEGRDMEKPASGTAALCPGLFKLG